MANDNSLNGGESENNSSNRCILVVEDNQDILLLTRSKLERAGYSVVTASDGHEALTIFAKEPARFNLVIIDLMMPEMSGDTLALKLAEADAGVKILFMSGYAPDTVNNLQKLSHPVMAKPFTRNELLEQVEALTSKP